MMRVIRKVWDKYLSKSFFRKIFWVYLGITVVTQVVLFALLTNNLVSIKYDQALIMSDQCLSTVNAFLENKVINANSIHSRTYQQDKIWTLVVDALEASGTKSQEVYQQQDMNEGISRIVYGIDKQFNGMLIGSYQNDTLFSFGNGDATLERIMFKKWLEKNNQGINRNKMISARMPSHSGSAFSVFLLSTVKSNDFKQNIGCMCIYFSAMTIRQSYMDYEEYLKGTLYVLNKDGEILYDSSKSYEFSEEFPLQKLLESKSGTFTIEENVYNVQYSSVGGYYVVNVFPVSEVWEDVKIPQRTMLFVFVLAFFIAIISNSISTYFFAKRLKPITNTMKMVREGHLTSFPIQKKYDDEVGYIYTELLRMCASLDDHIQKEYVYKLKQKEMEMYALQAQINPHFLYNTLEAIRMKLYINGETEASKMIWIFSDLFRNIMKKNSIVTNREEINFLHSYLELFQFRLGGRMQFIFDVEEEVYRYATIKHILQPIVENALVHGVEDAGTEDYPCTITIHGRKEGNDIIFEVYDDGCGISEEKLSEIQSKLNNEEWFQDSIGIYNVSSRLRIVYGPSYRLSVDSEEGKGTRVTVRIKALRKKELESYVQIINC